jgi:hypothetical protein
MSRWCSRYNEVSISGGYRLGVVVCEEIRNGWRCNYPRYSEPCVFQSNDRGQHTVEVLTRAENDEAGKRFREMETRG